MNVCFYTLGCKVNQHETGALQQLFYENGYTVCDGDSAADICIVNSCTVTASGDRKSLQWLRRAKRDNPACITVLTGCYPQAFPLQAAQAPADIVLGNTNRSQILHYLRRYQQDGQRIVDIRPHTAHEAFEKLPPPHLEGHTRAFLKVEDGCNRVCAYCIIPAARGSVRSRSEADILDELRRLAADGYREAVLSGINLSCYGTDTGTGLAELAAHAAGIPGLERIRLGSLEPDLVSADTWRRLSGVPKLCPQFHLSLQSGCDATLRRMNRHYSAAEYRGVLELLSGLFDRPAFTTDVIVGFPGETEEDFEESLRFVTGCGFLKVHVFSYSPRPGTPAAKFDGQVPESVKAERSRRLSEACEAVRAQVIGQMLGMREEVLLERPAAQDLYTGYTRRYVPVLLHSATAKQGDIVPAVLERWQDGRCIAKEAGQA